MYSTSQKIIRKLEKSAGGARRGWSKKFNDFIRVVKFELGVPVI